MATDTVEVIGAVLGGLGSLVGIGESLFGGGGVSMPSLQIPSVKTFQIPQAQLAQLNQQIASNNQLSTEAKQVAQQALTAYSRGQLSSAYAAQYQQAANQLTQQVKEALAGQGLNLNSTQGQAAMQQLSQNLANLKAQFLQKQLDDSLKAANLSNSQITAIENAWTTQANINTQNNETNIAATNAANQAKLGEVSLKQQELANKANTLANSASLLGSSLGSLGKDFAPGSLSNASSNSFSLGSPYSVGDLMYDPTSSPGGIQIKK